MTPLPRRLAAAIAIGCIAVAGCTSNDKSEGERLLTVDASDSACAVSATTAPAGTLTFRVTNKGTQVTEFYLLANDGLRIIGEVENIGPGLTRDLVVVAPHGEYVTACKPGMKGEGIRATFTVNISDEKITASEDDAQLIADANKNYKAYVQDQSAQLLEKTEEFVGLYTAGKDDEARALYPVARTHWERIETVAESFGDLDPEMDAREADLEEGQEWTGWHVVEKDLWPQRAEAYTPLTQADRERIANGLLDNTRELNTRVQELDYTADQIANGSRGLLEEVASGKVTGEEEYWSRTDLWDFQANVDGARVGFDGLRALVDKRNAELATRIDTAFKALQALLDSHRAGDGFKTYDQLTEPEVKALSDAVNALSEPLSQLTAVVVG